jgi:hypothetical protein
VICGGVTRVLTVMKRGMIRGGVGVGFRVMRIRRSARGPASSLGHRERTQCTMQSRLLVADRLDSRHCQRALVFAHAPALQGLSCQAATRRARTYRKRMDSHPIDASFPRISVEPGDEVLAN